MQSQGMDIRNSAELPSRAEEVKEDGTDLAADTEMNSSIEMAKTTKGEGDNVLNEAGEMDGDRYVQLSGTTREVSENGEEATEMEVDDDLEPPQTTMEATENESTRAVEMDIGNITEESPTTQDVEETDIVETTEPANENSTAPLPQSLFDLYNTYYNAYIEKKPLETHLPRAKEFALRLLEYYFPSSEGFMYEPTNLGPMAKYGVPISWKEKMITAKDPHHLIPPHLVAGYLVKRTYDFEYADGRTTRETVVHTVLGILIDDLGTLSNWALPSSNRRPAAFMRGDLFNLILGFQNNIRSGFGILIVGPTIEFYDFLATRKDETVPVADKRGWAFYLNHVSRWAIDGVLGDLAARSIQYENGYVGESVVKRVPAGETDAERAKNLWT